MTPPLNKAFCRLVRSGRPVSLLWLLQLGEGRMEGVDAAFFGGHPDPMWIYDRETLRFLAVNEAAISRYGYSEAEFLAMDIGAIRPPEDVPDMLKTVARVTSDGSDLNVWRHRTKDGSLLFVDVRSRDLTFEGRAARVVDAREVSHLLRLAQQRMEMVDELATVKAKAAEAVNLVEIAGRIARLGGWQVEIGADHVVWTKETADIHEAPPDTVPTVEQAVQYYAPEYRQRIREAVRLCAERGASFDEVLQIVTGKGNRIWVRAIGEAQRNADGGIVAIGGAFQDISELVEAREEAARLSKRLLNAFESISDGFAVIDPDWTISFANSEAQRLLERSEPLTGKNIWQEFPEAVGSVFQVKYEHAIAHQEAVSFVEYFPPLRKWLNIKAYPSSEGLAVYFQDVSDQRAREEQLRLLEAAVAHQNDILLITKAAPLDGPGGPRIVYVNDAFTKLTGYSRQEAIGNTPRMLQGPGTDRDVLKTIRGALASASPVTAEIVNYDRTGNQYWLELSITPLRDPAGRVTHFVAVERDVTSRKTADAQRQIQDERFRLVSKATSDVIWDWDLVSRDVWWSEGMLVQFGHDPSLTPPSHELWSKFIHEEDRDRVLSAQREFIEGTAMTWRDEYRFHRADGSIAIVVDRAFAIRDATGKALRVLGSMVDMTERRELDERLQRSQKLEAVGQLTGGVAHDFNNLLTVILGNSEMLYDSLSMDPELGHLASITHAAAEKGAELTKRLLAFARQQPLQPKPLDIDAIVGGMQGLFRRTVSEDIAIEVKRSAQLWRAFADEPQLESALLNLVINARDAMPDGGTLTIETRNVSLDDDYAKANQEVVAGPYVMVAVSDNGVGMTPDILARAVEPFFTTKSFGAGSGLGLSMVYGYARQTGGHIKIYSEPGYGTTVKMYLPCASAEASAETERLESSEVVGGHETILVAEDDTMVREFVETQLRGLGYTVLSASNGTSALEILRTDTKVDLLFTDVVMPGGLNGKQLADAAYALRPSLRVIFTSGYTENAIVHGGRLDLGVDLLNKPYNRVTLAGTIREVLDREDARIE